MSKYIKLIFTVFFMLIHLFVNSVFANNTINSDDKYDLKSIAGYNVASISDAILDDEEVTKTILNDLLIELRPYLKGVIKENIGDDYVFSSKEVLNIVAKHPVKFLTSIYNYVVNSMKEVFTIAEENAVIVGDE